MAEIRAAEMASDPSRRLLPWPYVAILLAETLILTTLLVIHRSRGDLPLAREMGWMGAGSMVAMQVYSLRKRVRLFARLGPIRAWLEFHIFAGLQGALMIAYHSAGISRIATLAGADLALMMIVVASGFYGRYLFAMLPRAASGTRLTLAEIRDELDALGSAAEDLPAELVRAADGGSPPQQDLAHLTLTALLAADWRLRAQRRRFRKVARRYRDRAQRALLDRRLYLERRLITIEAADRVFSRWTLFHRPLTFALLGATALHVLSAFVYGPSGF